MWFTIALYYIAGRESIMDDEFVYSVAQGGLDIKNPVNSGVLIEAGEAAGLSRDSYVVDFGCGNGTLLLTWHERFGISGTGVECREDDCTVAEERIKAAGAEGAIQMTCGLAEDYIPQKCDCAVCLGSFDMFGGVIPGIGFFGDLLEPGASLVLGDRYWKRSMVPPEFAREWPDVPTEYELFSAARDAGFEVVFARASSDDDWDRYESGIWSSCLQWLGTHGNDPMYDDVRQYLRLIQDEYIAYGREFMGWGLYVMKKTD